MRDFVLYPEARNVVLRCLICLNSQHMARWYISYLQWCLDKQRLRQCHQKVAVTAFWTCCTCPQRSHSKQAHVSGGNLHFKCLQNVAWPTWHPGVAKTAKLGFKSMNYFVFCRGVLNPREHKSASALELVQTSCCSCQSSLDWHWPFRGCAASAFDAERQTMRRCEHHRQGRS